ncbi:diadenosine tetraphosphate hydrolase [bacterium]|nr:diadenosine tetraphosphate hydrolase [bacterium]|tara:strand:- start:1070 stop:1636 length:567 start_codon:yes stop_codon:yes gene_type:complete
MSKEVSAGIIIYRRTREGPKYLILYQKNRYWNFPKGKLEEKERSFRAAIREVKEETGINYKDLRFRDYFKAYDRFVFMREGKKVSKLVMFYLAESNTSRVRIEDEHDGYVWLLYPDAIGLMKYKNLKDILKKANDVVIRRAHDKFSKKSTGGGQKGASRPRHHVRRSRPRRRPAQGSASRKQHPPQKS